MTSTIRGTVASVLPTLEPPLEPPFMRIDLDAVRAVVREEVRAALTDNAALRQASEQALTALESPFVSFPVDRHKSAEDLRAALAQQAEPVAQQAEPGEPVAWVRLEAWKSGQSWPDDCFTALPAEGLTPLYTTSPARKPLTDEEIAAEWQKASECASKSEAAVTTSQFVQMFARAIERALGIGEEK